MNQSKIVSVEWISGISTYKKDIKIIYNVYIENKKISLTCSNQN